ncbi:MAG: HlyD family efflux transporter periplasmic adaptor subunit [Bacteroidota bacterium]
MAEAKLIEEPEDIRINDNQHLLQILGKPPGWFLRWGITVVFFAIVMLMTAAWLIKFPDVIYAEVILTTKYPPVRVFTRANGKLSELLVENEAKVTTGQVLALMENPARWEDINRLEAFLEQIEQLPINKISRRELPIDLELGDLQNLYAGFIKRFEEYQYFIGEDTNRRKISTIRKQIRNLRSLNRSLEKQKQTLEQVLALSNSDLERNRDLLNEDVASKKQVEDAEARYLQQKRELETLSSQVFNNNIQIEELNLRKMDLKRGNNEGLHLQELALQEDLDRLRSDVKSWKQRYLIVAPISGKISMSRIWSAQQFLKANEELLTVVPEEKAGEIIGKAVLPPAGSGKVKVGMPANVRLNGYPYQEYGSVETTVKNISLVPEQGQFLVELNVPDRLVTSYQKSIPFRQEMGGVAHIITEDRRILERIFDKILSIMKNR